jgi:PTS system cellobiose-specific IIC component
MSRSSAASRPSSADSKSQRFLGVLKRVAEAPFLVAVRDALPWAFAALLLALAIIAVFVPVAGGLSGAAIARRIAFALIPAFGVMAIALAVALPLALARRAHYSLPVTLGGTLFAFALALPRPFGPDALAYLRALGATGIFLAILMTGVVGSCIAFMRFPRFREVGGAIVAVAVVALLVFALHVDISHAIAQMLQPLARLGDSYPALLAIVAVETLLWLVGVHGPAVLAAIVTPVYLTLQMQNTAAFSAHLPLPHVVVVSLFLFVFPGGAGATLPLAVLLALSRIARLRRIGRLVILPALANMNEPLLFGLPVVLNPFLAIPFVLAPLVLATSTYAVVVLGWVARPAFYVPSAVPAPISTYLATLDPRAPLLLLLNLAIAMLIYLPFVRAYERHLEIA